MNNTIENLRKYNLWRRGDESIEQPDPKDIGIWIDEICEIAEKLERERNEAQKELSSIHQWIDRNHPDGFIDSQTYFQNLERVTDNWYDRLDRLEVDAHRFVRERDEARELLASEKITRDHVIKRGIEMQKERDEWAAMCGRYKQERDDLQKAINGLCEHFKISPANTTLLAVEVLRIEREHDEALAQVKELIYISDRAIALADIDFENDKFGVVSELRNGMERLKEGAK
jgi:hypothetical protein